MTALAADRRSKIDIGTFVSYPVAASTLIYSGSLVCLNAAGHAVPASDTAGLQFAGVAEERADNNPGEAVNSPGTAGAIDVKVRTTGVFEFATASTLNDAGVGEALYVTDDQTVSYQAATTNDVYVGRQHKFSAASIAHIEIFPAGKQTSAAAAQSADTKNPQGVWVSATEVDFAARPDQPSVVRLTLQDGIQRSFSGTLSWDAANGVADLGYDHADSQTGTDKFQNFFAVPDAANDALLTIVASDDAVSAGPSGYTNFAHVWTCYEATSAFLRTFQEGNHMSYQLPVEAAAIAALTKTAFHDPGAAYSVADTVPPTASSVLVRAKIQQGNGATGGNQLELFPPTNVDTVTTATTPSPKDIAWISTANVAFDTEYGTFQIPLPTATKSIGVRVWNDAGGGTIPTTFYVETLGWIDESIGA